MESSCIGTSTSGPEVTNVSPFGLWILYRGKEYFLDYRDFPWFLNARLRKVFAVVEDAVDHLRWPDLDVDLSLDSIKAPRAFPLIYEAPGTYCRQDSEKDSQTLRG
jgi:hypothetical protein